MVELGEVVRLDCCSNTRVNDGGGGEGLGAIC